MNLPQFKEIALPLGYTEEQCTKYFCSGGVKRQDMFEKGDEREIITKFKRWCGIIKSYEEPDGRKPKGSKEVVTLYSAIEKHISNATTPQLHLVIQNLERIIETCKANIENNKESDIKSKESQINVVLQQLKEMGVEYELVKKL